MFQIGEKKPNPVQISIGTLIPFSHEALALTMITWRKTVTNITSLVFFFMLFPLCLNVYHYPPPLPFLPCSFRQLHNSQPTVRRPLSVEQQQRKHRRRPSRAPSAAAETSTVSGLSHTDRHWRWREQTDGGPSAFSPSDTKGQHYHTNTRSIIF